MTDAQIIERIARAMAMADGREPDAAHGGIGARVWQAYLIEAGHALAAHRVLTNVEREKP